MIRILPAVAPAFGPIRGLINAGSAFNVNDFRAGYSVPHDYYLLTQLSDDIGLILNTDTKRCHYWDAKKGIVLDEPTPEKYASYKYSVKRPYFIDHDLQPAITRVIEFSSGQAAFECLGDLGEIQLFDNDYFYFRLRNSETKTYLHTCVNRSDQTMVWQTLLPGTLYTTLKTRELLIREERNSNQDNCHTLFHAIDKSTGKVLDSWEIPSQCLDIHQKNNNEIITLVGRSVANKHESGFCRLFLKEHEQRYAWLGESAIYLRFLNGYGMYGSLEDQMAVWKSGGEGQGFICIRDLETGEKINTFLLDNVLFERDPSLRQLDNSRYIAVGHSRTPWPGNYWQIVTFDEDDIGNPNAEVYEEPLMGLSERIEEGDQAYYRITVPPPCENFFQLHRQVSVALWRCGAMQGFHRGSKGKPYDKAFNGTLVCDLTGHQLNNEEQIAMRLMGDFMRSKFIEGRFVPGYDPATRIAVKFIFNN